MALVSCPNCGMQVSNYIRKCPFCQKLIQWETGQTNSVEASGVENEMSHRDCQSKIHSFELKVVGVSHEGRQNVIQRLRVGDGAKLVPDPSNQYDSSAVKVLTLTGESIGFIAKRENREIFDNLTKGVASYRAVVKEITGTPSYGLRGVVLHIDECLIQNDVPIHKTEIHTNEQESVDVTICQEKLGMNCYQEAQLLESRGQREQAVEMMRKAADEFKYALAQHYMGICYSIGDGVEVNLEKAVAYFQQAAMQNNPASQEELGDCYYYGKWVETDKQVAFDWFLKAAQRGKAYSQFKVGECFYLGIGVKQNCAKAEEWLKKALEKGYFQANEYLKQIEREKNRGN